MKDRNPHALPGQPEAFARPLSSHSITSIDCVANFIAALERGGFDPKPQGADKWESRCPAHDGGRRNLSITAGEDGCVLIKCHHAPSCTADAIVKALGLELSHLFPPALGTPTRPKVKSPSKSRSKRPPRRHDSAAAALDYLRKGKPSATWTYHDAAGDVSFIVARFDGPDGKTYRPVHVTPEGWVIGDPPGPLPLYHCPDLAGVERIYLTEGEKCCDLARNLGVVVTTTAHGADSPHKSDLAPLAGKEVVILPDFDKPGELYTKELVKLLAGVDPPPTVKVLRLPDLAGEGDDIEQWLGSLPDAWDLEQCRAELERLADAAPVETIGDVTFVNGTVNGHATRNGLAGSDDGHHDADHPVFSAPPQPIESPLRAVPEFNPKLLPDPLRTWALDIADRAQLALEFVAVGIVISLATVVGRKLGIRPKRHDFWTVVPNLWGLIVGRPGVLKTHALEEAVDPLKRLCTEAREAFAGELDEYQCRKMVADAQRRAAEDELKKAAKKPGVSESRLMDLAKRATVPLDDKPPTERRYMINDATVEKLGELLKENPNGILQFRDEMAGFLRSFEKQNRQMDRPFYLEGWNGTGSYTYDRIGRGTTYIPSLTISLLGGIQPGPLASYIRMATSGDGDDGLVSRFQLLVYPDQDRPFKMVDRTPNLDARDRAFEVFRALDVLDVMVIGAASNEITGIPYLQFDDEAQQFFYRWFETLETTKLRASESPVIESHLSKYRSLLPSLALLFHLVDVVYEGVSGPVSLRATKQAADWCALLEEHARRAYNHASEGDIEPALTLAERLRESLTNPFVARDVKQKNWKHLTTTEEVELALSILEDRGWLSAKESPADESGGRPTTRYHVNPAVFSGQKTIEKNRVSIPETTLKTFKTSLEGGFEGFEG